METKRRVLLIDDERDLVAAIAFQLRTQKGYEVITAYDGDEALKKIEEADPDIIILDINMPRMGGIEFYAKICDEHARTRYPVLVLTARANTEQLFKDLNVDGFISKPFDLNDLVKEVDRIIKKKYGPVNADKSLEAEGKPVKVMILEEDEAIAHILSGPFMDAGYSVTLVKDDVKAIEELKKDVPDIILVKAGLSFMSGSAAASKLRNLVGEKRTAFLVYGPSAEISGCAGAVVEEVMRSEEPQAVFEAAQRLLRRLFSGEEKK